MNYRPEIDGLRTIAVFAVILFHLNPQFLHAGYYGVDIFFVISGFLITTHLTKEIRQKSLSLKTFWLKRIKRLLPTLLFVATSTLVVSSFFIFRPNILGLTKDILPAIFSFFNFHAYFNFGDYWGGTADQSFFLHTWSLSVEEQFYLIFPILLLLFYKFKKNFWIPIVSITSISLGLFLYYLTKDRDMVFYLLPFRLWELGAGALASQIKFKNSSKYLNPLCTVLGLSLIVYTLGFAQEKINGLAVLPVLGTALVLLFSQGTRISCVLGSSLFVHFGKLSYSMYLWHWPLIVLYRNLEFQLSSYPPLSIYVSIFLLTYVLSLFTYHFIENKTRFHPNTPKWILANILIILGLIAYFRSEAFSKVYPTEFAKQTNYGRYFDLSPLQAEMDPNNPITYEVNVPDRLPEFKDTYKEEGFIERLNNNKDPEVVLIGDSHGVMWSKTFQEIMQEAEKSYSMYTTTASVPFVNLKDINNQKGNKHFSKIQRIDFAKSMMNNFKKWQPKVFVIACRWEHLRGDSFNFFEDFLSYLNKNKKKVILLNQPPTLSFMPDYNAVQYLTYLKYHPKNGFNSVFAEQTNVTKGNIYLNRIKTKYDNISVIDIFSEFYENKKVKVSAGKEVFYFDDDHLSYSGTQFFKHKFKQKLFQAL